MLNLEQAKKDYDKISKQLEKEIVKYTEEANPPPIYIGRIDVRGCLIILQQIVINGFTYKLDYIDICNKYALYDLEDEIEMMEAKI